MMTGSPQLLEPSRSAVEALGGDGVLSKPRTPDELAEAVMRHFALGSFPADEPKLTPRPSTDPGAAL